MTESLVQYAVLLTGLLAAGLFGTAFYGEKIEQCGNRTLLQVGACAPLLLAFSFWRMPAVLLACMIGCVWLLGDWRIVRQRGVLAALPQIFVTETGFFGVNLLSQILLAQGSSYAALWICLAVDALLLGCGFLLTHFFPTELWEDFYAPEGRDPSLVPLQITLALLTFLPALFSVLTVAGSNTCSLSAGALLCLAVVFLEGVAFCGGKVLLLYQRLRLEQATSRQSQEEMYQFMSVIRSQRHDYNVHIHTINGLIQSGQYDKCQEYTASVVADTQEVNLMMLLHEPTVAALVSGYRDIAREKQITLDFHISDNLEKVISTPYDTNRVIGNLMQNAIDALADPRIKDRHIIFTTLRRGSSSVIKVSNAILDASALEHVFQYGYTTKQAHEGIGLNSISRILAGYKGTIYYEVQGDRVEFVAKIPDRI